MKEYLTLFLRARFLVKTGWFLCVGRRGRSMNTLNLDTPRKSQGRRKLKIWSLQDQNGMFKAMCPTLYETRMSGAMHPESSSRGALCFTEDQFEILMGISSSGCHWSVITFPVIEGIAGLILLLDILNVMTTPKWRKLKGLPDPDQSELKDNLLVARHLVKYMFPRQYGLDSVFDVKNISSEGVSRGQFFNRHNFLDRELDLDVRNLTSKGCCLDDWLAKSSQSRGPIKTPKRLKNVIEIVEQIYHRHTRCGYRALLNKVCPSKVTASNYQNWNEYYWQINIRSKTSTEIRRIAVWYWFVYRKLSGRSKLLPLNQ